MQTRRIADARAFRDATEDFLARHEAEHNLPLGLLGRLVDEPLLYGEQPWFAVAEHEGAVVACALRTPPHGVVLCRCEHPDAPAALADEAHRAFATLPGVVGPVEAAARFAARWRESTGTTASVTLRQAVHACHAVTPVPAVLGRMRAPDPQERGLVIGWIRAFLDEALAGAPHVEDAEATFDRRANDPEGAWLVWDDRGPVSLAGVGNRTPTGIRVGPVYTPPALRGRGYATALVEALTQAELDAGRRFCFLFTDLANPTSNAIYARIGYEPVARWDLWAFVPPD